MLLSTLLVLLLKFLFFLLILTAAAFLSFLLYRRFHPLLLPGVCVYDHHWLWGNWGGLFANFHRIHDWKVDQALRAVSEGKEIIQRAGPFLGIVELLSPRLIQYVLKDNFDNFVKVSESDAADNQHSTVGSSATDCCCYQFRSAANATVVLFAFVPASQGPRFHAIFEDLLGNGIFNSDGDEWRRARKTASHMFSASVLQSCMLEAFREHAAVVLTLLEKECVKREKAIAECKREKDAAAAAAATVPYVDMQRMFYGERS